MSAENKTKGMCIATRCTSVEQFIQMFHRFVDEDSFFVSTHNTRPPGLETSFSVQLADGTPVLRGLCVVLQSWTNSNNVFKTPGVRLGIKRLTANSMPVFERLLVTRSSPTMPPPIPVSLTKPRPTPPPNPDKTTELKRDQLDNMPTKVAEAKPLPAAPPPEPSPRNDTEADLEPEIETRTPGSDYILPANPLQNLTDASLDGFVDCTLYEETGNFFPADGEDIGPLMTDDVVPPPTLAPVAAVTRQTPQPMPIMTGPIDVSSLIRLSAPIQVQAPSPESTVSSVVTPLPMPVPLGGSSVVTPLPLPTPPSGTSVVTPLPQMPQMLGGATVEATPLPLPPPPARETPLPVGERIDLEPHARKGRGRYLVLGGIGVAAAAAVIFVVATKGSRSSNAEPTPAKQPTVVAQADLPKPPTADETATDTPTETPDTPGKPTGVVEDPDGPPMIGDGPCKLTVATTPAGSTISLDGKSLAPSPLTIATTCEKHQVEIAHVRYETTTRSVTLDEAKPGTLDVSLNRPTHAVSMTSLPPGATIFIDGRRAGTTPTVVNVVGFQKLKLEFKKTGYLPQNTTLYSKVPQDKVSVRLGKW